MGKKSAGILIYRIHDNLIEVLLVHPGGPFWAKKDVGAWSIPKGEFEKGEDPLAAAKREVKEELGIIVSGEFVELLPVRQKSGKIIFAWALQQDLNPTQINSNNAELIWPPGSGKKIIFPEIDKAAWFNINEAKNKINAAQAGLIAELIKKLQ